MENYAYTSRPATVISIDEIRANNQTTAVQNTDFSAMNIGLAYTEEDMLDVKAEQAAEPIKNIADINRLKDYLLTNGKYRDFLMLIVGINTGLRYSDFSRLKFINFIDPDKIGTADPFYKELVIEEKKTKHTKKQRINRHIAINDAIKTAISIYLNHVPNVQLGDYLFANESYKKAKNDKPITCQSAITNFKRYAAAIGLDINFGTHTFRKTMGYHFMMTHYDDPRALQQLQKMFNHSSEQITLRYIGITSDDIREGYENLNLGL